MGRVLSTVVLSGALFGTALVSTSGMAEDLGVISVESTTIDDRFEQKRDEPSNTKVISGEKIDEAHAENLLQTLQSVSGVTAEYTGAGSLKIHIRGVENQRYMGEKPGVAVVIDGVPVFERTGAVNIDLDNIESIKVVKGGASYLFGDDALSGAVIITTKRGAKLAGYKLDAERGSFNYEKYLARAGYAGDNLNAHVQVSHRASDGYWFQSEYRNDYVDGKVQWYATDKSDLTFGFEVSDRAKDSHGSVEGITQAETDPKSYLGRDYARKYDVDLGKYYLTYAHDVGANDNLMVNVYQFGDHTKFASAPQSYTAAGVPVTDVNAYTTGNDYKQIQRGIKSEYRSAGTGMAWMAGLDLRDNNYRNFTYNLVDFKTSPALTAPVNYAGTVTGDDETRERVHAAYGEVKFKPAQKLTVTANGRYDQMVLDYESFLTPMSMDKTFNVASWRLGGNYAVKDNADIYTNVSTGFRAPSISQLFAGTITPTGKTASNPDLEPEHSLNMELGYRGKTNFLGVGWNYDTALFQIQRNDYIMSSAGQYSVPAGGTQEQYQNIGGMRSRGLEFSLNSDRERRVVLNMSYTYLRSIFTKYDNFNLLLGNRYRTFVANCSAVTNFNTQYCLQHMDLAGKDVPRTPQHHLNTSLDFRVGSRWTLTGEVDAYSSYYADEPNFIKVDPHTVLNALARYDMKYGNGNRASFFLRIDNVLDKNYFNTARASTDSNNTGVYDGVFNAEDASYVVNPGRVWTSGVSVKF